MKRRLNFTGRRRIPQKNVSVCLIKDKQGNVVSFNATIDLNGLGFPSDAKVYVDAYRRYELRRFEFGTVGNISPPSDTSLMGLTSPENMRFRILVVDESGTHGKILGLAEVTPEAPKDIKPILDVEFRDIEQRIWKIEFIGDEGSPRLVINKKIPNAENMARYDPRFVMDVYPAVLKEILTYMMFIEGIDSIQDPSVDWHKNWLEFAKTMHPENMPTEIYKPGENNDPGIRKEWLDWFDEVVDEFCLRRDEWVWYVQNMKGEQP